MGMPLARRFVINLDRVVHETIDGETIIIQLETGTYYSLAGPGAEAWAMLAAGRSTDEVVEELEQRYEASTDELAGVIADLVRELRREELLEDDPDVVASEAATNGAASSGSDGARAPFDSPELKKYTDMQYFLLLDPIHEVDGIGWPNPPSEQTAG
jgi:hypothetical protein